MIPAWGSLGKVKLNLAAETQTSSTIVSLEESERES